MAPPREPAVPLPYKLAVGGVAGILGTSIIFPLDMVKTRLQNQSALAVGGLKYTGPIDCFRKIVATEGVSGLYQGLKPNLIGVTPEKAIKLTVNDVLREWFTDGNAGTMSEGRILIHQEMLSGAGAGFFQVAATNPMEIVKLRMQLAGEAAVAGAGAGAAAVKRTAIGTISELGLRGLYRGTAATWLRDVPFSIVFFPLFANLKTAFNGNDSMLGLFAAGAIAGSLSAGSVTPCDVIKTRLQVRGSPYTSIGHAARSILRDEGPGAFFKGLAPRMVVQAPLFGITLFAFDVLKRWYASTQAATR